MAVSKKLHFWGIAGHTMRGLALAARELGYEVTGTDPGGKPPGSDWLDEHQIMWWKKSDPRHVQGVDILVVSGGIPLEDPELKAAEAAGIPVVSYAQFVGDLAKDKRRLVVAGTHGKTTTASLLTWLLESAGKQPDYLIGIQPRNFDTSVRLSDSPVVVLEGDEYMAAPIDKRSKFAYYKPDVLITTSLEMDHPDLFPDIQAIIERFHELVTNMAQGGHFLYWSGSPHLAELAAQAPCKHESYGEHGDWHADHVSYAPEGLSFDLYEKSTHKGHYQIGLYGRHNVDNATAAIAAALGEGLSPEAIQAGCQQFAGAARRFQIVSRPGAAITVVDDYAHHPTEIAATIEAAKAHFGGRVIAVVRPHTYSRTKELLEEYRQAVRLADAAVVADIEGAREAHLEATVSGEDIARDNGSVRYEADRDDLIKAVEAAAQPGDIVLSMTVSGYNDLAEELAATLN